MLIKKNTQLPQDFGSAASFNEDLGIYGTLGTFLFSISALFMIFTMLYIITIVVTSRWKMNERTIVSTKSSGQRPTSGKSSQFKKHVSLSCSSISDEVESQKSMKSMVLESLMNKAMKQMSSQEMVSPKQVSSLLTNNNTTTSTNSNSNGNGNKSTIKISDAKYFDKLRNSIPPGWEVGTNIFGKIYYIDHTEQKTTWEHPLLHRITDWNKYIIRKTEGIYDGELDVDLDTLTADLVEMAKTSQDIATANCASLQQQLQQQNSTKNCEASSLPPYWEKSYTQEGIPYYINHKTRQTSWVHPETKRPGVLSTQTVYVLKKFKEDMWKEINGKRC